MPSYEIPSDAGGRAAVGLAGRRRAAGLVAGLVALAAGLGGAAYAWDARPVGPARLVGVDYRAVVRRGQCSTTRRARRCTSLPRPPAGPLPPAARAAYEAAFADQASFEVDPWTHALLGAFHARTLDDSLRWRAVLDSARRALEARRLAPLPCDTGALQFPTAGAWRTGGQEVRLYAGWVRPRRPRAHPRPPYGVVVLQLVPDGAAGCGRDVPQHHYVLLHGFPYDVRQYDAVRDRVARPDRRVVVPYLRGFGPTRYRAPDVPRSGQQAALGKDVVDLLDALDIGRAVLVGYDWGGRAACVAAALWPERVGGLLSAGGYVVQDIAKAASTPTPPDTAHAEWYQHYFNTALGRLGLAADRDGFCRLLWRLWSPGWRFTDAEYARTAAAFHNPDFVDTVVQSYRHRYANAPGDPARLTRFELLYELWRDGRAANAGWGTASLDDARSDMLELLTERVVSETTAHASRFVRLLGGGDEL